MMTDAQHTDWRATALRLQDDIGQVVVGQRDVIRLITVALFARGHVLLEGDVGVGKTTVLRAFARCTGGAFERIEGTIDLMPSDLIYHTYIDESSRPRIDPGPLLRHEGNLTTFFFNEINRARPQVQSLLLRAMAERSVSAFNRQYHFPHMLVFADRNKVEKEETFELAAAARDRFLFELSMRTPFDREVRRSLIVDPEFHDTEKLLTKLDTGFCDGFSLNDLASSIQNFVRSSEAIEQYLLDIWQATHTPEDYGLAVSGVDMAQLIQAGTSPRGMSALMRAIRIVAWLDERDYIIPEDVHTVLPAALGHRIFFRPVYELRRSEIVPELIQQLQARITVP